MLHRFEKDAGHWIEESPAESAIRIRGLRKITFALFALGICLTCLLNSRLLLQGVNLQQLIVCNLGIMMVFVLAGIFLLHDVTVKKRRGLSEEINGVRKRLKVVVGQIDELDSLRFKMKREHHTLVANRKDLYDELIRIAAERNLESEKTALASESLTAAQAEWSRTQAAIADESAKLVNLQQAIRTLESEMEAKGLDYSACIVDQQGKIDALQVQYQQSLSATQQSLVEVFQAEELAKAIQQEVANLQSDLQSLEVQKTASTKSRKLLELEFQVAENPPLGSHHALMMTQEEYAKVTGELAVQQAALQAAQEIHFQLLMEIELLESEKAASQSSLTSSKLELVCVELECARIQSVSAEKSLLIQASAELEQLKSTIAATEQGIAEMAQRNAKMEQHSVEMERDIAELEQERSMLQRNIEYSNALEAVASNRSATLNQQVTKLESDQLELSEALEHLLGVFEEKSRIRDGLANQNIAATASLESLLDSVEQLSRKEADLLSACNSAEQKMGDWTTNVDSLVTRVDDLTTQIATFEEQRLQAIEALENILEEIDLNSAVRASIADSIEKLTQQMSDLDAVTKETETVLEDTASALQYAESALRGKINQLETYETQLSQASESCSAQQTELLRVQSDLLTEQHLLAQIQSEIAHKTDGRIAVESDLVDLEKLKLERQIACDDANTELERLIQQLDTMSEELMTKGEQSRHLNTKLGQLRELDDSLNLKHQKLDELDKQQLQSEQSCEDAREHLIQLQADTRTVQLELDRLSRKESELTLKSNKMRSENEQLEANYDSSNHKLQTLQHELSTLQMKRSQLETEIQASEQSMLEIQRTIDNFANEADEAQAVCKQWADYGAKLRNDNKEVESEIANLRLECKELRAEQDRSLREKQAVTAGLSTLKGQSDTLNTEIANREDFLLELKEEQTQVVKQIVANNNRLEQTQANLDRLASEHNFAKLELDGLHNQRSFESSCVQELAVQHQQLQGEVYGLTQVLEQLRTDVEQHELALDTQKTNRLLMDDCIREAKAQQLDLENRLSTVQREFAIASESVAAADDQEQKHLDGIHSLQGEADEHRIQIDSLQQQLKSIEFELDENRENARRLDSKLEATRDDCQQAGQLLFESQNKAQEIVRSIADREKELAETEHAIRGKHLQSQSLDIELSKKNAVLVTIQQALADTKSMTTEQEMHLVQVQDALESLRSRAVALECDLVELSRRKAEADASIAVVASYSKDLQNLNEALASEKTSQLQLLETEKTHLDTAIHERVQLESANRTLEFSNDSMLQAIRGLQSQRDELTKLVSDLNSEIGSNKNHASQLQTQIEASSAQIAQLEQSRREWMDKESTTIQQVARMRAELKNLESQQSQAKQELEAMVVPTQSDPKSVLDRRSVKLLPTKSEVTEPTSVELAQEILEEISDLASFDNTIVGQSAQTNESDFAETSQNAPSEDPWSVVLK